MTTLSRIFGFPQPEDRDSVRFHFAKNLPYNIRINLTLILLVAGFVLQLAFMNPFIGIPFLIIGVGLVLVKGYDSRIRLKSFNTDPSWKNVPLEKIQEIDRLRKRSRKWDRDALDVSNPLGFFSLLLFGGLALALSYSLGILAEDFRVTVILAVDTAVLVLPLWLSGMRFILKQPNLAIKVKIILKLYDEFKTLGQEGEQFKPSMMLALGKVHETVPVDVRFSVAFPGSPEGFYGLQAQINLNVVQGTSYPYFYCVLAAKPGFELQPFKDRITLEESIICEYQKDKRAEVLVIRQKTTKKSGYHTKDKNCAEILRVALEAGRLICR
ncbi:MAG: hypothetical protein JXB23_14565 [Candidatus Aminicenantes bacterium]|nr:hypothetical protein [Candidatus Aminicenantes bacterium]